MKVKTKSNKAVIYFMNGCQRVSYYLVINCLLLFFLSISGCKKFIQTDAPIHQIYATSVYTNDNAAIAVLTGIYIRLSTAYSTDDNGAGLLGISKYAGLSADEFELSSFGSAVLRAYYTNDLLMTPTLGYGGELWSQYYSYILSINTAIEGLIGSSSLTPFVKQQLLGEAKFMRALVYFYMVNTYGDVPLVVTSNYETNRLLARSPKSEIYKLIINDLKEAQSLLSEKYLDISLKPYANNPERTRPTKWAATALLARAYLYTAEYGKAEIEATAVINQSVLFNLVALSDVFLKNSDEAILQLQPVNLTWNTEDARLYVLSADPVGPSFTKPIFLSTSLMNAFEKGDNRKEKWTGNYESGSVIYPFAYKYKIGEPNTEPLSEYTMVLRLAEQYLIRAEAKAQQNNITGAITDLNLLRIRARAAATIDVPEPLPDFKTSLTQAQLLDAILQERRIELFSEWGHRWFDLKRTGKADALMSIYTPIKGGNWDVNDQLYPIPFDDLLRDPNLKQNEGYK